MKRGGICPKCKSQGIGSVDCLPDMTGLPTDPSYQALGQMGYKPTYKPPPLQQGQPSYHVKPPKGTLTGRRTVTKVGAVEGYVCAGCGYVEMYAQDPQWVPYDKLEGFSWVEPGEPDSGEGER